MNFRCIYFRIESSYIFFWSYIELTPYLIKAFKIVKRCLTGKYSDSKKILKRNDSYWNWPFWDNSLLLTVFYSLCNNKHNMSHVFLFWTFNISTLQCKKWPYIYNLCCGMVDIQNFILFLVSTQEGIVYHENGWNKRFS